MDLSKRKPVGPPPGTPPPLSDSEDEEYDPAKGKSKFINYIIQVKLLPQNGMINFIMYYRYNC